MAIVQKDYEAQFELECDGKCKKKVPTNKMFFREAVKFAKEAGWELSKDKEGNWVNFCPDCK